MHVLIDIAIVVLGAGVLSIDGFLTKGRRARKQVPHLQTAR